MSSNWPPSFSRPDPPAKPDPVPVKAPVKPAGTTQAAARTSEPANPAKPEKSPAEKGAATKKRNAAKAAKAEKAEESGVVDKQASFGSLEAAAQLVIACLRGPDGGDTKVHERALDALERALGRDPSDQGRVFVDVEH